MGGPRGFQKCRRCDASKPLSEFPSTGRVCFLCAAKTNRRREDFDPFRFGVDVKGFDKFLRLPLITLPGDPRDP